MRKHTGMKSLSKMKSKINRHNIHTLTESKYFKFSPTQSIVVSKNVHGYGTILDIGNHRRTITKPRTQELQGFHSILRQVGA